MSREPVPFAALTYEQQVKIAQRLPEIAGMIECELEAAAGTRVAFSLLTWGGGRTQYISNGQRPDTKAAMKELVDRWDSPGEELGIPALKGKQE